MRREKLMHFSHQHPLREFKVKEYDGKFCSCCEQYLFGSGTAFKCKDSEFGCNFSMHKSCLELPQHIYHNSHKPHPLTLHSSPANYRDEFLCNACGEKGSAFAYHCSICYYDLHVNCSSLPETVTSKDHQHPLNLHFSIQNNSDGVEIVCDVCDESVKDGCWVYCCIDCDFGTHLDCVNAKSKEAEEEEEEEEEEEQEEQEGEGEKAGNSRSSTPEASSYALIEAQLNAQEKMQRMQLQMQLSRQQAQMMIGMGRSLANLAG